MRMSVYDCSSGVTEFSVQCYKVFVNKHKNRHRAFLNSHGSLQRCGDSL